MVLGSLNAASPNPGSELDYTDGRFMLGTGQQLTLAEVLRLDSTGAVDWADEGHRQWLYQNQEKLGAAGVPVPSAEPVTLSADRRSQLLAQAIQANVVRGGRVETQGPFNAVIVWGKPVNHILHLILTLLTAGAWGLVWLILALSGGEKRTTISVDDFGNVLSQSV
jgi:hypothetical protein